MSNILTETEVADKTTNPDWRRRYALYLAVTDLGVLLWVVFGVQIAWFGADAADVKFRDTAMPLMVNYTVVSMVIISG